MKWSYLRKYVIPILIAFVWLLGPGARSAQAYIDPGTGSSLFTSLGLLLGVITTCLAIGLTQVKRCGGWFLAKIANRRRVERDKPSKKLKS